MVPSLTSITSRLRLKQLRLLIALEDRGSLHKAAQHISISQSGATKALHEVESLFGMPLFERQPKGLVANAMGRCVIRHARLIHNDVEHLREDINGLLLGHCGRLSVGAVVDAMPRLTEALPGLLQAHPRLSLDVQEQHHATLLDWLEEGRLDVVICGSGGLKNPQAFECVELSAEPLTVVAHPAHRLAGAARLHLAELHEERWIAWSKGLPLRQALDRAFLDAELPTPRYALEASSAFATALLLQQDPGLLAVIPAHMARFFEDGGQLIRLPVVLPVSTEPSVLLTRVGARRSLSASWLINRLSQDGPAPALASNQ